jgi:hypothetical protein
MAHPLFPMGQAVRHGEYVYFAHPYPMFRVKATAKAFADPARWETYTPLKEGSTLAAAQLDRDADGRLRFAWRVNTPAVGPAELPKLSKLMRPAESPFRLCDRDTGKPIYAHAGSVAWNEHRKRWTMIFVEQYGKPSVLGEVWYAEADELTGPWRFAVKVATHDRMSFYNPKQHPEFAKDGGKVIYFEGTYTHDFSGNPDVTPRYEYNQLMYRLDLGDVRTALPRPIPGADFLALDRQMLGTMPVPGPPRFFMPPDKDAPAATVPLYEFARGDEKRYSVEKAEGGKVVGRVWPK